MKSSWDQNQMQIKAEILGYAQIREMEELELIKAQAGVK